MEIILKKIILNFETPCLNNALTAISSFGTFASGLL